MQDNNAERRNLVVTSYAFIAISVGDATLTKGVVSLNLINVEFQNINHLVLLIWLTLIWFLYRYWLTHKGIFIKTLKDELRGYHTDPIVRGYFKTRMGAEPLPVIKLTPHGDEKGYYLEGIHAQSLLKGLSLVWRGVSSVRRDKLGSIEVTSTATLNDEHQQPRKRGKLVLNDLRGRCLTLRLIIRSFCKEESFSAYLVPYLLFMVAVIVALPRTINLLRVAG